MLSKKAVSLFCLIIISFFNVFAFPQVQIPKETDSLEKKINEVPDSVKIEYYRKLSTFYKDFSPPKGVEYAESGIDLAVKLNNKTSEGALLIVLGQNFSLLNRHKEALKVFIDALKISHQIKNRTMEANALNAIGLFYYWQSYYERALEFLSRSLVIKETLPDSFSYASTLNNIGLVQYHFKNYGIALDYLFKAKEIKIKSIDLTSYVKTIVNIGLCYSELGEYDKALKELNDALKISEKITYPGGIALCLTSIGMVYASLHKFDKAESTLDNALAVYKKLESQYGIADVYYCFGRLMEMEKKYQAAINYNLKSLTLTNLVSSRYHIPELFLNLSELYKKKGDYVKALAYKDSLINFKEAAQNNEVSKYQYENNILEQIEKKERELSEQQIQMQKQKLLLSVSILSLFVLILFTAAVFYMLSKKRKIANELNITKTLLETAFNETPVPLLLVTVPDLVIKYNNVAAQEIFGFPENFNITETKISDIEYTWDTFDKEGNVLKVEDYPLSKGLKGEKVGETEIIIKRKDGSLKYCLISVVPVFVDGRMIAVFEAFPDITHLKEIEAKLQANTVELKELNSTKDKFFSIIAHDLKSPFHGFLGLSEIIATRSDTLQPAKLKKLSNELYYSLKNQYHFLDDLLQWSRIQTGRIKLSPEPVLLSDEISNVFDLNGSVSYAKSIKLKNSVDESFEIIADKEMLRLILRNLVSNAVKFSTTDSVVEVKAEKGKDFISISVKDSGIGIKKEDIDKLFRLDIHYTTKGTNNELGTGLGLILCKELVEKHGGTISVESEFGRGSCFTFTIKNQTAAVG
jgi:Signal transduction histidine kinase